MFAERLSVVSRPKALRREAEPDDLKSNFETEFEKEWRFEGDRGFERLVEQASLDRFSDDRQLQYRFASHETLLHQFQLLEPLDELFR